jgi:hypothetical protein
VNRTGTIIESEIRDRLVGRGQALFDAPHGPVQFAKLDEADRLLNDLDRHPHAFVIACVMNRQIKAERAWLIPHAFAEKLGGFSMETLARLSRAEIRDFMAKPAPLHHFVEKMSGHFWSAVQRMATDYGGDASGIWAGRPASAAVVYRFLEFDGVGPKIASMAANILARDFKIPFADYYSIDISADVHVRRDDRTACLQGAGAAPGVSGDHGPAELGDRQELVQAALASLRRVLHEGFVSGCQILNPAAGRGNGRAQRLVR